MIYLNENDPGAAAWLRELIKQGHLPDGHVDERSIADVQASDLKGYSEIPEAVEFILAADEGRRLGVEALV